MTWDAQVRHLVARDLRGMRWALVGFAALIVLATLRAVGLVEVLDGVPIVDELVPKVAPLIVAMAILADPARRTDAFWAVLPVRGSAVAAAKLVVLLLLAGVMVVVSHVVRIAWGLPVAGFPALGGVALLQAGASIAPLALLAATCRDLRGFVLAVVLMIGAVLPLVLLPPAASAPPTFLVDVVVPAVVVVLCGGMLVARYARHGDGWRMQGATLVAVALAVMLFVAVSRRLPMPPTTAADFVDVRIALLAEEQPVCADGRLVVPIEAVAPAGHRLDLLAPAVTITTVTGARVVSRLPEWGQVMGTWGPLLPPRAGGARWRIRGGTPAPRRTAIAFPLSDADRAVVCGKIARAALAIDVRVSEAQELVRLPIRTGATVAAPGVRAAIRRVAPTPDAVPLVVRVDRLSDAGRWRPLTDPTYALVDEATGDALVVDGVPWSQGSLPFTVRELPGLVRESTGELTLDVPSSSPPSPRAAAWAASRATLLVTTSLERAPLRVRREAAFTATTAP
jgi:hypothetical protein